MDCKTSSERNVRLVNGTLALTAVREGHYGRHYTSAEIWSKKSFTYGRFEVRAALPSGKMLEPVVNLENTGNDIMFRLLTNRQTNTIITGKNANDLALQL